MDRRLGLLIPILAVASLALLLGIMPGRLMHPFELEWQEGGMLAHLVRLRAGQPLYAEPSLEFIAFPYPPLFHWAAGVVSLVTGPGLVALRLVSILATLATLSLLALFVRRETGSRRGALVAAGLFAAAFSWAGAWMDVGRVDSLALTLTLGSFFLARFGRGSRDLAAAGVLAGLALLTKQTTVLPSLALGVALLLGDRRRGTWFLTGFGLVGLGGLVGLHLTSEGWSTWYLFELLGAHPWEAPMILGFWSENMIFFGPTIAALLLALHLGRKSGGSPDGTDEAAGACLWAWSLGLLASAWMGRAHIGGHENTLMPAALALALLGGRLVGQVLGTGTSRAPWILAAIGLQFAVLIRDPRPYLPSSADREAGEAIVRALEEIEGPVFAPYQPYLAARAGAGWSAHAMTFFDISAARPREVEPALFGELKAAFAEGRYAAVLLAEEQPFVQIMGGHYSLVPAGQFPGSRTAPVPVTGTRNAPRLLYLRR